MKFSRVAWAGLLLSAGALVFLAGWTLRGALGGADYTISGAPARRAAAGPTDQVFLPDEPVDLNAATVEELMALPGIGRTRAQAIVDYRAANGPFAYPEDLMEVPGIGQTTFDRLADCVTTSP